MKIQYSRSVLTAMITFFTVALLFTACEKDDSTSSGSATTTIKITDAPIDDASVTGAFVTITDIQLDGQSVQGFSKTTIDLNAYRNGATHSLGNFNLQGKTYSSITFVLDYNTDANGNTPGCYVVTAGSVKHKLQSSASSITVNKNITIDGSASNSIVADFDLRKMIMHQSGTDHFDFVTAAELNSCVRVVAENNTGTISGTLTDNVSASAKIIAYAYKKGTFVRATEMQGQGASGIEFKNAVCSGLVNGSGSYELHFLESGEYEIQFVSYKDDNADGEFEVNGTLIVTGSGSLNLLGLTLNTGITITANATVTAVLP
jgi:hypothetical protein